MLPHPLYGGVRQHNGLGHWWQFEQFLQIFTQNHVDLILSESCLFTQIGHSLDGAFGITDRWEAGVVVPLSRSKVRARAASQVDADPQFTPTQFFCNDTSRDANQAGVDGCQAGDWPPVGGGVGPEPHVAKSPGAIRTGSAS